MGRANEEQNMNEKPLKIHFQFVIVIICSDIIIVVDTTIAGGDYYIYYYCCSTQKSTGKSLFMAILSDGRQWAIEWESKSNLGVLSSVRAYTLRSSVFAGHTYYNHPNK